MKTKQFLTLTMLVGLMVLVGGCHYGTIDNDRRGSYRDGYREGRARERRRDDWRNSRYDHRDYYRRRW